ncbi:hypothetical protein ASD86_23720 [Lysobacter sp. Root690]|nr:hypothetical protein ASD86_23720 [Lysobacter sp. Root690]
MIRHWLLSAALVTALFAIPAAPVQARLVGGLTVDNNGPRTVSPGGGFYGYGAYLRHWDGAGYDDYHFIVAYTQQGCMDLYFAFMANGWQFNPNPGVGLCREHTGFHGYAIANPGSLGTGVRHNWSTEAVRNYEVGVRELRERYRINEFSREQELLIKTIEAMPGAIVEGQGGGR